MEILIYAQENEKDRGKERMIEMKKRIWIGCIIALLWTMALGVTTVAAGDETMKDRKWISGTCGEYVDTNNDGSIDSYKNFDTLYYKITIPKQGYIMVDVNTSALPGKQQYLEYIWGDEEPEDEDADIDITVLNSKKKPISFSYNSDEVKKFSFGLKKGTYYLAVEGNTAFKLRYTFTPVTKVSKAGKNFAKAAAIKNGITLKNLLVGATAKHYYKLKLTRNTKVVLECDPKIKGDGFSTGMVVQMFVKKGKKYKQLNPKGKVVSIYSYDVEKKKNITYTLSEGTYYLRVWSMGSGYYTMKWK